MAWQKGTLNILRCGGKLTQFVLVISVIDIGIIRRQLADQVLQKVVTRIGFHGWQPSCVWCQIADACLTQM